MLQSCIIHHILKQTLVSYLTITVTEPPYECILAVKLQHIKDISATSPRNNSQHTRCIQYVGLCGHVCNDMSYDMSNAYFKKMTKVSSHQCRKEIYTTTIKHKYHISHILCICTLIWIIMDQQITTMYMSSLTA